MTLYSYIVALDAGFAPNPFHEFCTLACCKPGIRRTAQKGDYVVGLAPKALGNPVVYAMQVLETLDLEDYWYERQFRKKRPDMRAGGISVLGDNIYHRDREGNWQQEWSQHSHANGQQNWDLTSNDVSGENVLIARDFIYWGPDGPPLPGNLEGLVVERGYRSTSNEKLIPDFVEWFEGHNERGRLALPTEGVPSASERMRCKRRKRC